MNKFKIMKEKLKIQKINLKNKILIFICIKSFQSNKHSDKYTSK